MMGLGAISSFGKIQRRNWSPNRILSHRQEKLLSHPQQRACPVTSELKKILNLLVFHIMLRDSLTQIKYCKSRIHKLVQLLRVYTNFLHCLLLNVVNNYRFTFEIDWIYII
jgi:hypothetical protein